MRFSFCRFSVSLLLTALETPSIFSGLDVAIAHNTGACMSARRLRLTALVFVLIIPATLPAQFGGLGKILDRAKAKVDSARATVDTAQRIADSAKATANEAANITKSTPHATASHDTTAGKHGKSPASTSNTTRSATTAAGSKNGAKGATGASQRGASGASGTSRTSATTPPKASGGPSVTEAVYAQFTRGFAVEKALRKANPKDAGNALSTGVTTSGLSQSDYTAVKTKLTVYYGFALGKQKVNTPLLTTQEVAVLDTHKDDVVQLMGP
jgi:hypothetical protein